MVKIKSWRRRICKSITFAHNWFFSGKEQFFASSLLPSKEILPGKSEEIT
jgi:hypothetical protein